MEWRVFINSLSNHLMLLSQENKASKNLIEHLKDQIGDKETKVKELEEIQNTIMNMMQATKKKKNGWVGVRGHWRRVQNVFIM